MGKTDATVRPSKNPVRLDHALACRGCRVANSCALAHSSVEMARLRSVGAMMVVGVVDYYERGYYRGLSWRRCSKGGCYIAVSCRSLLAYYSLQEVRKQENAVVVA
mmetsp:Transcript_21934/g.41542  ORF Transcript_21934/g.41542 Transcript_21934/m.41542 type:complete len:106 (-) Transcript_21934:89-406(-)